MMKAVLLSPGTATYAVLSRFLLMEHALPALDGRFVGYMAIWDLFHRIERGEWLVFCVFSEGRPVGVAFGYPDGDTFYTHLIFERYVDAVTGSRAAMLELVRARPEVVRIVAEVPKLNRAVRLLMRRLRFCDTGRQGREYLAQDGKWHSTNEYEYRLREG